MYQEGHAMVYLPPKHNRCIDIAFPTVIKKHQDPMEVSYPGLYISESFARYAFYVLSRYAYPELLAERAGLSTYLLIYMSI